ncbi:GGDEF domain-containing phosphodiesterase [Clostridium sp.]|uniref:EAL domain-containing protein n=1 Tax=Clostridium sp. TaxID=1506 RepID=UPI003F3BB33B
MDKLYRNSNRYKFIENLKSSKGYYLVCIDIINFRSINDKFSFHNGDKLLSEIIEYIGGFSTNSLNINSCRYENDIIMIMFECNCENDIFRCVDKITHHNYRYDINFRVGYIQINNINEVEHFLESIIYVIKDKKYTVDKSVDKSFKLNIDVEKYFAIKQDIMTNDSSNFNLVYQPKISNKDKHINSCEVLSRWSNAKVGESSPDEFLPIIKNLDKEVEFDLMIFEKACLEISEQKEIISKFSINISTKSISDYKFIEEIYLLANRYNIKCEDITLEILEDICVYNQVEILNNVEKLVKFGFSISIDDFGTGYSSYCRLAKLNFSEVKIPREFLIVEKKDDSRKNKEILTGIVSLCRSLNCSIVIEGVETEENLKLAQLLNIDYIQGYYYSMPLNKIEYVEFINEYNRELA